MRKKNTKLELGRETIAVLERRNTDIALGHGTATSMLCEGASLCHCPSIAECNTECYETCSCSYFPC